MFTITMSGLRAGISTSSSRSLGKMDSNSLLVYVRKRALLVEISEFVTTIEKIMSYVVGKTDMWGRLFCSIYAL